MRLFEISEVKVTRIDCIPTKRDRSICPVTFLNVELQLKENISIVVYVHRIGLGVQNSQTGSKKSRLPSKMAISTMYI